MLNRGAAFLFTVVVVCAAHAQVATINKEHDVPYQTMTSDRFTWIDSGGNPRLAVLAHNDQNGPAGTRGGELRQFTYKVGAATRNVTADVTQGPAGFGYIVSHANDNEQCIEGAGIDSSSFGHLTPGTWTRVFEGRHHVIFRFQQNYPRYCTTHAAVENDLPITIDWVFSTGRDHPLWAVTYDLTGVAANDLLDDSRAPYGELLFDGSADHNAHSTIAGVGWGDGYKFVSTSNPVTFNSGWDWSVPNTVPYVKLWTTAIDATMGIVQTQTLAQQDAGGYFDASKWGKTSADGNACGAPVHTMPCDYNWDYQTINYSLVGGVDASTNSTRLAWGTEFGFLGQTSYPVNGSSYWGGPYTDGMGGDKMASGFPASKKKSYSTYIVFGTHTNDPVDAQVTQIETIQSLTLTAVNGTVVTAGAAGVADATAMTYAPAGYNHVYGALAFNANNNQLDANINVGNGTLRNPLIIVGGFTVTPTVKLAGATLTADVDYFASLRTNPNEVWITLNRNLAGAVNHLEVNGVVVPAAPAGVTTLAVSPSQINVSWNPVAGADSYEIDRKDTKNGNFVQVGTSNMNSFSNSMLALNTAYIYRVRAKNGAGVSGNSAPHLATTVVYSDNPLAAGVIVKAAHLSQLRSALTAVCTLAVSGPCNYTDAAAAGTVIKAVHITELRSQLDTALAALSLPVPGYTDNAPAGVVAKAVHFEELRDRMQ